MERPIAAGVATMLGGLLILIAGAFIALAGAFFALLGFFSGLFFVGLALGAVTMLVGLLMIALPIGHTVWGFLAIALAVVSLPFALGGFLIGFLLAVIGGVLSVRWRRLPERTIVVEARTLP